MFPYILDFVMHSVTITHVLISISLYFLICCFKNLLFQIWFVFSLFKKVIFHRKIFANFYKEFLFYHEIY